MRTVYQLGTCSTCKRIIADLKLKSHNFTLIDVKEEPISADQLDILAKMAGSYEALFSKTAQKYRLLKLFDQTLSETDYKNYILSHYTFLKRPLFIIHNQIYIGSSKPVLRKVSELLENSNG